MADVASLIADFKQPITPLLNPTQIQSQQANLQGVLGENQINAFKLKQAQDAASEDDAIKQGIGGILDPATGRPDTNKLQTLLYKNNPKMGMQYQKEADANAIATQNAKREADEANLKSQGIKANYFAQGLGAVKTVADAHAQIDKSVQDGMLTPQAAQAAHAQVPQTDTEIPDYVDKHQQAVLPVLDQVNNRGAQNFMKLVQPNSSATGAGTVLTGQDKPTGAYNLSDPNLDKDMANIADPQERAAAQDALNRQKTGNNPFTLPYDPKIVMQGLLDPNPKVAAAAKVMQAENDKVTAQNTVSANTRYATDNKQQPLVITMGADGKPVYTNQKDAVGQEAAAKPSAAGGAAPLTPDAIEIAATRYRVDGTMPALGMGSAAARAQILNKAAEQAAAEGNTPEATALRQVANKANAAGLAQLTKQQTMVGAFEKTANSNANLALSLSDKVDRLGSPVFDRWLQAGRKNVAGDENVTNFNAANQTFVNEYAKIMSGSMGNTPASDSARNEANSLLSTAFTKEQYKGVVAQLKTEMQNRINGFADQKKELMANMGSASTSNPAEQAPNKITPLTNGKGWKLHTDANGNKAYVSPDNKSFEAVK